MTARRFGTVLATRIIPGTAIALLAGAIALAIAWGWPLPGMARDLFSAHMLQHLLAMNVAALLIAVTLQPLNLRLPTLATITILQLAALWIWHMPAVFASAHHSLFWNGFMQLSLFGVAVLFWKTVLDGRTYSTWRRIFALLITAKVFCLLGAVFVFSRRTLYPGFGQPENWGLSALEDQQLAGLMMVSSCALIYVAAAVALFARWLFSIGPDAAFAK